MWTPVSWGIIQCTTNFFFGVQLNVDWLVLWNGWLRMIINNLYCRSSHFFLGSHSFSCRWCCFDFFSIPSSNFGCLKQDVPISTSLEFEIKIFYQLFTASFLWLHFRNILTLFCYSSWMFDGHGAILFRHCNWSEIYLPQKWSISWWRNFTLWCRPNSSLILMPRIFTLDLDNFCHVFDCILTCINSINFS